MASARSRTWLSGFVLAAFLTIGTFAARVAVGFTGGGDAAVMQLVNALISFFGGDVARTGQPVVVGLIETLAAGLVGGWIAVMAARRATWRTVLVLIVVVTLFLQLLFAAVPFRVG